jgi:hypothetical protein
MIKGGTIQPAVPAAGEGTLYGVVFDEDGVVPGALVIATDGEDYAFDVANSEGIYQVLGAPTGDIAVIALAELHHPGIIGIELIPNEPAELNIFLNKLEGFGKLYGHVEMPGAGPLSGVYVNYAQPGGLMREDLTNIYGMYELEDIPAGPGFLYGHKQGFHDVYEEVVVEEGFNEFDFYMIPIDLGTVKGEVKTPEGDPVAGAFVRLTYTMLNGDFGWMFTYSGAEGEFAFGDVPPGPYAAQSFIPGWHPGFAAGTVFECQVSFEELWMWPTQETGVIEGWALDFNGDPVPYAFGFVTYLGFHDEVSAWTIADENGHFYIEDVPFGAYAVHVETAVFLPSWTFVDILPSSNEDFLTILYPFDPNLAGALAGTVFDTLGEPVAGAIVGCWSLQYEEVSYKTFSDGHGDYVFPLLPPLCYAVFALGEAGFALDTAEVITGQQTWLDLYLEPAP